MANKSVAIFQSSYIPWKGTFDLINSVDELILLDDVQYTRRDWRNRNRVKTAHGPMWLSIPVWNKGRRHQFVQDAVIADPEWNRKHWKTLRHLYGSAAGFRSYRDFFEELYLGCRETRLSVVNRRFLEAVCELLRIPTRILWSTDYGTVPGKTERLVDLCRKAGADRYLSGPTALAYLKPALFESHGIEVEIFHFGGYREYEQLYPPFDHHVSIVDLLFNAGSKARKYLNSGSSETVSRPGELGRSIPS